MSRWIHTFAAAGVFLAAGSAFSQAQNQNPNQNNPNQNNQNQNQNTQNQNNQNQKKSEHQPNGFGDDVAR